MRHRQTMQFFELTDRGMSLMYTRNNSEPRTLPWGTPDLTPIASEKVPLTTTC